VSLLDGLLEGAEGEASSGSWVESAVERGRAGIEEVPEGDLRDAAGEVLNLLDADKDHLGGVAGRTFVASASMLSLGRDEDAKLAWLGKKASFREMMDSLKESTSAVIKEKDQREEDWEHVKDLACEILKKLGSAAIPYLLALIV